MSSSVDLPWLRKESERQKIREEKLANLKCKDNIILIIYTVKIIMNKCALYNTLGSWIECEQEAPASSSAECDMGLPLLLPGLYQGTHPNLPYVMPRLSLWQSGGY